MLSNKQDKLIDGVNISTINGTSILNGGNIDISAEHGALVYDSLPTSGSNNLVKSGGIYDSLENTKNEIYSALTPVTLFESSTPNYDNITLSDSVANYDTIEVFGETSNGHLVYYKLFNCNGKKFILCTTPTYTGTYAGNFHFIFKEYTISENIMTCNLGNSGSIEVTSNGKHNQTNNNSTVGIVKILGYKNV